MSSPYSMTCKEFQLPQTFGFTRVEIIMGKKCEEKPLRYNKIVHPMAQFSHSLEDIMVRPM